jgi:hypothetical protein
MPIRYSMSCPACGHRGFLLPRLRIVDVPWLLVLLMPVECYRCRLVFRTVALPIWRCIVIEHLPAFPRVRVRVTGSIAASLRSSWIRLTSTRPAREGEANCAINALSPGTGYYPEPLTIGALEDRSMLFK